MTVRQCLDQVHEWRFWKLTGECPKLNRLAYLERKIPDFICNQLVAKERTWLVRSICEERIGRLATRVINPNAQNIATQKLELKIEKLALLLEKINARCAENVLQSFFQELPIDTQELFIQAVCIGRPGENVDAKSLRVSLFNDIHDPLIFLKGKTLCEQALHFHEVLYLLETQRDTVQQLEIILNRTQSPFVDLNALVQQLPLKLQNRLREDIYRYSANCENEAEYGKQKLRENLHYLPRATNEKEKHLLTQYLHEQKGILLEMQKMKEIEEFDRLTVLYPLLNRGQWNSLLQHASAQTRGWIKVFQTEAVKKERLCSDDRYLYQWRGAHPELDSTRFQVFAPHARQIKLVLTAYGKEEHCIPMQRKDFGVFEVQTHHAHSGRTYRYLIENCHGQWGTRTDPFGLSVMETNDGGIESVVSDPNAFVWSDQQWMDERGQSSPSQKPLSIYEAHAGSWKKKEGNPLGFRELAHEIVNYHKKVPFTHIQLYGILDHKNTDSWGYQVDHFFAANRRLGNVDDFKSLVNLCHHHHIGVIIDWIPTHYKHEHCGDSSQSLHDYDGTNLFGSGDSYWGTIFFDFNKDETRRLLLASALYWFEEMHVDGMRVDAVSPMIRRNDTNQWAAIDFLKELNRIVHERYPGILMIAEETDGFPKVTIPSQEGGLGFDAKVGIHMQSRARNYFRTPYAERSSSEHHHDSLLKSLEEIGREQWLVAHSHDDAASGGLNKHSTIYGSLPTLDPWRKFADMRLFHAWNLLTPGFGHGIHMGDEIGQRWPWNERLHWSEGSVEWHLLGDHIESNFHRGLQMCVGDLNRLYCAYPAFWKQGARGYQLISHDAANRVIGFHRLDYEGQRLGVFFNFSPNGYDEYNFPLPHSEGDPDLSWIKGVREIFNTDGVQYGGTGNFKNTWGTIVRDYNGNPTHFRFAFPPLSVLVFKETWD